MKKETSKTEQPCTLHSVVCSCWRCGNKWEQNIAFDKKITKATFVNCEKCQLIGQEPIHKPYCE